MDTSVLNLKFFKLFNTYLGEDVEIDNPGDLEESAEGAALALKREGFDKDHVAAQLNSFLSDWTSSNVKEFSKNTEVAWYFSDESTKALKIALQKLVATLEA